MEVPRPHMVSLHTTMPPYRRKRRAISIPGRSSSPSRTRKNRLRTMWTTMMTSSSTRAVRVARAAPSTPRAGAPSFPKMSTQFKKVLTTMDTARMYMPSWGRSMLR